MRGDNWRDRALCLQEDPELFFPIGDSTRASKEQAEAAKAICKRCEVVDTCLKFALENNEDFGIWGAHTEEERRAVKRRQARAVKSIGNTAIKA